MKVSNSVDWDIYRIVGAKVGRGNNGWVDSDIDTIVGSGYYEGVELKFLFEVSSGDGSSVD